MDYDFEKLKKFKINPKSKKNSKIRLKDSRTLLKNVYDKKNKLERKCIKIKQKGGSYDKIIKLESDIDEITSIHKNLKNLVFLNNGIIEIYKN